MRIKRLSEKQLIFNEDKSICIVMNGEVSDNEEEKRKLESSDGGKKKKGEHRLGVSLSGRSDSRMVAGALRKFHPLGISCARALDLDKVGSRKLSVLYDVGAYETCFHGLSRLKPRGAEIWKGFRLHLNFFISSTSH